MSNNEKEINSDLKFGLKSFITICIILFSIMVFVGILTFIVPAGKYIIDENGKVVPDSFSFIESTTTLPVWRWVTAPFEALLFGEGNFNIIQIIAVLLVLGGTFKVLDKAGLLSAVVHVIVNKFYNKRYLLIWIITLLMMLLSSCFGLQEELLILFPILLAISKAMRWSKEQAVSLILITTGVGFTTATFNPFTIGVASNLAGISVLDGLWYRALIFVVLYFFTCLYLIFMAKKDEKLNLDNEGAQEFEYLTEELSKEYSKKAQMITALFVAALLVIVVFSIVPVLADLGLGMVFMALTFVVGTFIIGKKCLGSVKETLKGFMVGVKDIAPSIIIILLAFSVKYIAEKGNILHTTFYYCHNYMSKQSPYFSVIILYLIILVFEFFIPGSLAKALLLIPLLTLAPLPGISVNIIMLAFLFGDGYTNVLYPTCGTLVLGLSLANVSFVSWLKRTGLFQILLFVLSVAFLLLAVYIGL
jgi:uncharacterized ion transporter superfamily protein YfcC